MGLSLRQLATGLALLCYSWTVLAAEWKANAQGDVSLGQALPQSRARRLLQGDGEDVCYEGCFAAPIDELADPLPIYLMSGDAGAPVTLLDCYAAAVAANLTYFAIVDKTDCFGGNTTLQGWAPGESCPLDCAPDTYAAPFACGDVNKAALFSMGMCQYLDAPCAPEDASPPPGSLPPPPPPSPPRAASPKPPGAPLPPKPPAVPLGNDASPPDEPAEVEFPPPPPPPKAPSPPPPKASPPPPAGKQFRCKPGVALWGTFLHDSPLKLSPTLSTKENLDECQRLCAERPDCEGYYYKTTQWCYLMSEVYSFSKTYGTAVQSCRVGGA